MSWLKCNKGVNRNQVNRLLNYYGGLAGKISVYTSMDLGQLKLTFNKFNGINQKEYNELIAGIFLFLIYQGIVDDYKL